MGDGNEVDEGVSPRGSSTNNIEPLLDALDNNII